MYEKHWNSFFEKLDPHNCHFALNLDYGKRIERNQDDIMIARLVHNLAGRTLLVHVFIDDSGDPGFKLEAGSSRHFVIACCVFESPSSAEKTAQRIRDFKVSLGWPPMEELKFSKTRSGIRFDFLNQICSKDLSEKH